ncbi:MAG: sugar phosphate isomerase/epimerase [Planctomycetaceae bacterium]|nr:sugar phosphate isomerase/epimerase [Planctomycetaceae bacterium]
MQTYKLGICEWSLPLPGPAGLGIAAEMGLRGVELLLGEYEKSFPLSNPRIQAKYLEEAAKHSIEFPSIALNSMDNHGMSNPMESVDGVIAVECLKKGVATAASMKIPLVQIPSFVNGAITDDVTLRNTCEKLRMACRLAAEHGIVIASENDCSPEDTERMVAEVACDNFRIFYDTQNYFLNKGYSQPDVLRKIHRHVVQLHLKDGYNGHISSALLGCGETNFRETAEVIKETRCSEWLILENYYNCRPMSDLDSDPFALLARDIVLAGEFFPLS